MFVESDDSHGLAALCLGTEYDNHIMYFRFVLHGFAADNVLNMKLRILPAEQLGKAKAVFMLRIFIQQNRIKIEAFMRIIRLPDICPAVDRTIGLRDSLIELHVGYSCKNNRFHKDYLLCCIL